ncbi:carbamoyl phosphate synthase small subunit [Apilactobacillus xinyiensis]|uniref:Carbamoyl phosphate synthase small chain n=1 Tax=Apilactobacillus xinyiensis TaxID=2841032 RepID=A0ABT0I033_9LACO|nr:carbamoyl phosphate synthase small subunit [Apilactobacillus xinyiensis]MCK8624187.1 carbamoyl phosphate synthase small subunit [Apilactobacillus xinyiensis]MCL0318405.1 carbamoyl phosphate synthase small subunit [Apilactobacillus xinyiensis]
MMKKYLVLEDGHVFVGESFGSHKDVYAEIVFNTGMTGYQETITDNSYKGQIVTFTYPIIGNYGINLEDSESDKPAAEAIIVHELARRIGNKRADMTLQEYADENNLPGISGIDTRELTEIIRNKGSMKAAILSEFDWKKVNSLFNKELDNTYVCNNNHGKSMDENKGKTVAVINFGIKDSIIAALQKRNIHVVLFPYEASYEEITSIKPSGILLSNGPGNPENYAVAIPTIQRLEAKYPLMGICLGHQLFALANGAKTYKMKYGHRGFNHAVNDFETNKSNFTSQNHGYAVDAISVTQTNLQITQKEINDGTVEGLKLINRPAFSVQYHPDACPGPHDAEYMFDRFINMMIRNERSLQNA